MHKLYDFLCSPYSPTENGISIGSAVFASFLYVALRHPISSKKCPITVRGSRPSSTTWLPETTWLVMSNIISIESAVFRNTRSERRQNSSRKNKSLYAMCATRPNNSPTHLCITDISSCDKYIRNTNNDRLSFACLQKTDVWTQNRFFFGITCTPRFRNGYVEHVNNNFINYLIARILHC